MTDKRPFAMLEANETDQIVVPYDENLLELANTHWQFGDWSSLTALERSTLQNHPERAKLALLVGAALFQADKIEAAREYLRLSETWGADKKLICKTLIAGIHNSLGKAYLAKREDKRALKHIEDSIATLFPKSDRRLMGESRAVRQATQLGLLPQASKIIGDQIGNIRNSDRYGLDEARLKILETEIELLNHELSLAQQRQQLFTSQTEGKKNALVGSDEWKAQLKKKSVSQLGQDLWVLEKTGFKQSGFFVEFGATDGVLLSNTWLLEKEFGWHGICAEPNPKFYSQLQLNRKCSVSDQYIGSQTGQQIEFILADAFGGSEEFATDDLHKEKREAYRSAGHVTMFTSISLHDFLVEHQAPRDIDYLSVDTEGSEYDLLSTFPFETWNIQLLTVEHNFTAQRAKTRALLESKGYRCTEQQWDDWYEKVI